LIFNDPEMKRWETADEYLGGNVVKKLNAAIEAGLKKNIEALRKVLPDQWTADKVTPTLGSTWIPRDVYEDFIEHLTGEQGTVFHQPLVNAFTVRGNVETGQAINWNTPMRNVVEIVEAVLNSMTIRVTRATGDGNKRETDVVNTDLAMQKAEDIKSEFDEWVFKDTKRRQKLVKLFNDKYNVRVTKQRDGQHLTLPGKVPDSLIKMRRHQLNGIWRGIVDRFVLYDHAVGAGKTFTAIARAMERRRMGLSQKPMIVVPNHLVEQFAADVYKLYPGAKLLAAGRNDLVPQKRRRLFARIATGDWDIVIIPHSSFEFIGISPLTEERYLNEELELAEAAVIEAQTAGKNLLQSKRQSELGTL